MGQLHADSLTQRTGTLPDAAGAVRHSGALKGTTGMSKHTDSEPLMNQDNL